MLLHVRNWWLHILSSAFMSKTAGTLLKSTSPAAPPQICFHSFYIFISGVFMKVCDWQVIILFVILQCGNLWRCQWDTVCLLLWSLVFSQCCWVLLSPTAVSPGTPCIRPVPVTSLWTWRWIKPVPLCTAVILPKTTSTDLMYYALGQNVDMHIA